MVRTAFIQRKVLELYQLMDTISYPIQPQKDYPLYPQKLPYPYLSNNGRTESLFYP